MATVFLTGATGYIGGQALTELLAAHRQYTVRALVRDPQAAKKVTEKFPQVQIVSGSLDDSAVIEEEATKAGIVLNLASNKHVGSLEAIQRGFLKRTSPSYWVQISGASALGSDEIASPSFQPGQASDEIFDDLKDAGKIRSLVQKHSSRVVDNFIFQVAKNHAESIKTALILPPIIYGPGDGPGNQRSVQIPSLSRLTIQRQHGVRVGKGLSRWGSIQISDLGHLIAVLTDSAAKGSKSTAIWGEDGIYLPSSAEISFGELSERVAHAAYKQGLIKTTELEELSPTLSDQLLPRGTVFFGSNARIKSRRAAEELSWTPKSLTLHDEASRVVSDEAARLLDPNASQKEAAH